MAGLHTTQVFIGLIIVFLQADAANVTVRTDVGYLVGMTDNVTFAGETREINKFLGIPYAEPPVGTYRFRAPRAKKRSNEHIVVQEFGHRCIEMYSPTPQVPDSEDCLFLNVFSPARNNKERLPVMVFIYGGAFVRGSSNRYEPYYLVSVGQVIVVTINYRLGVWGFLSTQDSSAPGNYALWDQQLALRWVRNNIRAFGGDTSRITIFGESAGAASVIYQGLYPGNKGLFQRIIAQSGSASSYWAKRDNIKSLTDKFARKVGCYNKTVDTMVACLRNLPVDTINSTVHDVSTDVFIFLPTIDNIFVTCNPQAILDTELNSDTFTAARETLSSFDLLMGINNGEGGLSLTQYNGVADPETFLPSKTYFDSVLVPALVNNVYGTSLDSNKTAQVVNAIRDTYTDADAPLDPLKIRDQFLSMHSDVTFLAPMHETLQTHARRTSRKSYIYYNTVDPSFHVSTTPSWFKGSNHADELIYMFKGMPLTDAAEIQLTSQFITMWSNFAKTGNPSTPADIGFTWKPYTSFHHRYLEITRNMSASNMKTCLREDQAVFWNVDLPEVIDAEVQTCSHKYEVSRASAFYTYVHGVVVVVSVLLCKYM